MFTFGGGEHGQLGHGDKVNKVKPTLIQALEGIFISQITCGWSHSVALTSTGKVYSFGKMSFCIAFIFANGFTSTDLTLFIPVDK